MRIAWHRGTAPATIATLASLATFATLGIVAALSILHAPPALAQAYPNKPVRVIVPFAAGSGSDVGARIVAEAVGKSLGQAFVIDNRPGASGNIGMAAAAKAPPDGYTYVTGGLGVSALNMYLMPMGQLGFDPRTDFEPVILYAKLPFLFASSQNFAPGNVRELIAAIKAKPNTINVAIPSSTARLVVELFNRTTNAPLFLVPYKAATNAVTDVVAGTVTLVVDAVAALRPQITSGRLKPIAVTTRRNSELLPGVSSLAEQGLTDWDFAGWVSLYAPRGTPREAIAVFNAEMNKALLLPDTKRRYLDLGFETGGGTPQDLFEFENAERNRWGPLIKAANITAE